MIDLRPYQTEAIDAVRGEFARYRATLLVLATGLGKTVTFAAIAARCAQRANRVLIVAHRGELLDQAAATLRRFGLRVGIEQGARRVDRCALPDVVVASVQTLRGKRLQSFAQDSFALVVIDEAHHALAPSYRGLLTHFASAKVLGVTATPDRADGKGLRSVFESTAYQLDLAAGIKGGWLAPLELRTVRVEGLDLSAVRVRSGDLAPEQLEAELLRDGVLHETAKPLAELSAGRQTLAFVAGVQQAHALADVLGGYGVKAAAIDGETPLERRAAVLAGYRAGEIQVVCNAMLLTEGFDAPETTCVALVRPTRSRSLLMQMIGRGTRLAEGKTCCLILDFVPGRMASVRLASPADALAGEDLDEELSATIRAASSETANDLAALIHQARAERDAAAEKAARRVAEAAQARRRRVQEVGVIYEAARIDVASLLECVVEPDPPDWRPEWRRRTASPKQIARLRDSGFNVTDTITQKEADALSKVLADRMRAGLCTLKQAKKLQSYGLRDDVSFSDAREALDAIAANGWNAPGSLYADARFALQRQGAA